MAKGLVILEKQQDELETGIKKAFKETQSSTIAEVTH